MTTAPTRVASPDAERPRPRIHFTADDGWINDPYGVTWIDDRYHLYYQAVPGQVVWGPQCTWGHAHSPDLVHWQEQPPALVPAPFEVGCWSGSVVTEVEPATIFYTRVSEPNLEIGQVATATLRPDGDNWQSERDSVVVAGPPPALGLRAFRDPNVIRVDDSWVMLMAAALPDGAGAVLQYRSTDLNNWSYEGVLCTRPNNPADEVWTGALWECPQLFRLDDQWVLLVSVWNDGTLHHVAAARGRYDGRTFEADSWQQLTHGPSAYATSAFVDNQGRRCIVSWLREEPQNNDRLTGRAGAHSVVSLVSLTAEGKLQLQPHPDVDALRTPARGRRAARGRDWLTGGDAVDLVLDLSEDQRGTLRDDGGVRLIIESQPAQRTLVITRPGFDPAVLPIPESVTHARVLIDADIVEIFAGPTYGAYRIQPPDGNDRDVLTVTGATTATAVHLLRP